MKKPKLPGMTVVTEEHPDELIFTYQVSVDIRTPKGRVAGFILEDHLGMNTELIRQYLSKGQEVNEVERCAKRLVEALGEQADWKREIQRIVDKIRAGEPIKVRKQSFPTF